MDEARLEELETLLFDEEHEGDRAGWTMADWARRGREYVELVGEMTREQAAAEAEADRQRRRKQWEAEALRKSGSKSHLLFGTDSESRVAVEEPMDEASQAAAEDTYRQHLLHRAGAQTGRLVAEEPAQDPSGPSPLLRSTWAGEEADGDSEPIDPLSGGGHRFIYGG